MLGCKSKRYEKSEVKFGIFFVYMINDFGELCLFGFFQVGLLNIVIMGVFYYLVVFLGSIDLVGCFIVNFI